MIKNHEPSTTQIIHYTRKVVYEISYKAQSKHTSPLTGTWLCSIYNYLCNLHWMYTTVVESPRHQWFQNSPIYTILESTKKVHFLKRWRTYRITWRLALRLLDTNVSSIKWEYIQSSQQDHSQIINSLTNIHSQKCISLKNKFSMTFAMLGAREVLES